MSFSWNDTLLSSTYIGVSSLHCIIRVYCGSSWNFYEHKGKIRIPINKNFQMSKCWKDGFDILFRRYVCPKQKTYQCSILFKRSSRTVDSPPVVFKCWVAFEICTSPLFCTIFTAPHLIGAHKNLLVFYVPAMNGGQHPFGSNQYATATTISGLD